MSEPPHLWRNARIATCDPAMRRIERGALLTRGGLIEWLGEERDRPPGAASCEIHDLGGAWVTPGLIDCHTHLVFSGTRAAEYAERLRGRSYEQIARAGGGIAHAGPPEFTGGADAYIEAIATHWLPALREEGLIDALDVFCESVGFTVAQAQRLYEAAAGLGLPVKMHSEQLSNVGGSLLAARFGALSCDHLEQATAREARALAGAGTVAVLLPVAYYCLGGGPKPPVSELRAAGTAVALATDCNPGSAPGCSLLAAMSMGTRLFGLTCEEALAAVTRHAARALGLQGERGVLAAGMAADFVVWSIGSPDELGYWVGFNPCRSVIKAGRVVS